MSSDLTIVSGLDYFGRATPSAAAWTDGNRTRSFGEILGRSERAASALALSGIGAGRHVAVMLDNQLAYPEVIAAIAKAGAVIVPINTHSTPMELADLLIRCEATAMITESKYAERATAAAATYEPSIMISVDDGTEYRTWEGLVASASRPRSLPELDEMATFCVSFTGGSTGEPKGVMINHRSRALTFHYMALDFGLGPGRRTINATPLYHGAGMAYGYGFMTAGSHVQTMRKWDPEHLLALVASHQPHQLFLVPAQIADLRDLGSSRMREAGFDRIQSVFSSAAPLPDETTQWFISQFPEIVFADVYGGTEAGVVSVLKTPELGRRINCAGPPWFMTEIRLLDGQRREVPRGEAGELFSRSPYVFNGYLNDPVQTRDVLTDDGFVTAGDIAIQDDDGYLYIVDRAKDLIISGGVNVYPREVEEVLVRHPSITDAAVVGVPHARWGEEVIGIVVVGDGQSIDELGLRAHCLSTLSDFKVPKRFLVRASLERTDTGKLQKSELREWATAEMRVDPGHEG